jgi:uncharacterized protein YqiB (DUF1249 family)
MPGQTADAAVLKAAPVGAARSTRYPWLTPLFPSGRPSVGALMGLCEENYRTLLRLVPGLRDLRGEHRSGNDGMALHLEVVEQAPYTTLLRLTYLFPHDDGEVHRIPQADPDALLRVYHDARQVEVLDLRQTALPLHNQYRYPALEAKWRANLFLSKWLTYCVGGGHHFRCSAHCACAGEDLSSACT